MAAGFSTTCCGVPSDLQSVPSMEYGSRGIPPQSAWEGPGGRRQVEGLRATGMGRGRPGLQSHLEGPSVPLPGVLSLCGKNRIRAPSKLLWINSGTPVLFVGKSKHLNRRLLAQSLPGHGRTQRSVSENIPPRQRAAGRPSIPRSIKQWPASSGPLGQPQAGTWAWAPWGRAPFLVGSFFAAMWLPEHPRPCLPPTSPPALPWMSTSPNVGVPGPIHGLK